MPNSVSVIPQHVLMCVPACLCVTPIIPVCDSQHVFVCFSACHFVLPSMSIPDAQLSFCSYLAWTTTSAARSCCLNKNKENITCFGQPTGFIALCMKLPTPTGCRNTRGQWSIALQLLHAMLSSSQQVSVCSHGWHCMYSTCAPRLACDRPMYAADNAAGHQDYTLTLIPDPEP